MRLQSIAILASVLDRGKTALHFYIGIFMTPQNPSSSGIEMMTRVLSLSDSSVALFHIRTRETVKAAQSIREEILVAEEGELMEWDHYNGIRHFSQDNMRNNLLAAANQADAKADFLTALSGILETLRDANSKYAAAPDKIFFHVFVNPHPSLLEQPKVRELLLQMSAILVTFSNIRVVLITENRLELLPVGHFSLLDMRAPTLRELVAATKGIITSSSTSGGMKLTVSDADVAALAALGQGMTHHEYTTHLAIGVNEALIALEDEHESQYDPEHDPVEPTDVVGILRYQISKGKTEVIRQSEIMELYQEAKLEDVGGMDVLKDWLAKRRPIFDDLEAAAKFGVTPPKGILLVGPPGTGKSLVAKAVSGVLAIPLVRLDFGKVFSKFVGDSERRLQSALDMVADMGHIVLFVDEIDKGMGGTGSTMDGGTSRRVLGQFLTWMQEDNKNAFVVMTANSIEGLPPELSRKGRIDQIFSTVLPGPHDRREVFDVHFRKIERDIEDILTTKQITDLILATEGFVPAEIEQVVKDAAILAFTDDKQKDKEITFKHLAESADKIIPMSISHKEHLDKMIAWSKANALEVSSEGAANTSQASNEAPAARAPIARARRTTRSMH